MSEALDTIQWTPPEVPVRDASAVILVRGMAAAERELFWVRRGEGLRFSGGFYAFPGGKVDAADAGVPIANCPTGEAAARVAAIRETFEEAGVLLARGAAGMSREKLAAMRTELLAGAPFSTLLSRERLTLDGTPLVPAGRWVTPPFSPVRFDARFYLVALPSGAEASVVPGELAEGGWTRPDAALAPWEEGRVLLHPPTQHALATLAGFPPEAAVPRLRRAPFVGADDVCERIEFQRGVLLFPMLTPTLPPARHTHCYVLGTGELLLVDPGSPWKGEQDRLEGFVRALIDEGRSVKAVALTHAHRDHIGAAAEMGRRFGVPVWASAEVAERVPGAEGRLRDGDVVGLQGPLVMRWRAVLTPGHAHGHLCFFDEASHALVAGDMVAGGSSIVIDPPEGDMGVYLDSLRLLKSLGVGTLYPAHGMAVAHGQLLLEQYLEHREQRMAAIEQALAAGASGLREIVERVYTDTPAWLYPAADRSALASLIELGRRGRAVELAAGVWGVKRD